jgi:hypothetical protein
MRQIVLDLGRVEVDLDEQEKEERQRQVAAPPKQPVPLVSERSLERRQGLRSCRDACRLVKRRVRCLLMVAPLYR